MKVLRFVCVTIALVAGCIPKQSVGPGAATPAPVAPSTHPVARSAPIEGFRRGINLGNGLDAPREGEWGVVLEENHFKYAAAAGFDHVRLPVRFNAHALETQPYTVDAAFLQRVDWALDQAQAYRLGVMLDWHHYNELMKEPDTHAGRFLAIWKQIAERYRNRPPSLVFELLNEPNGSLDPDRWNRLLNQAIATVRPTNPERRIVVDGYFWASADHLKTLDLPKDDANVIATFHMYQPILFTHQGADWMGPEYQTVGIVFPGPPPKPVEPVPAARDTGWVHDWIAAYNHMPVSENLGGPKTVALEFDKVSRYIAETGRRVYLGEFGAIHRADAKSRESYVRLVRQEAERRGIAWAYWDDGGSFKALDVKTGEWVPYLRDALLK